MKTVKKLFIIGIALLLLFAIVACDRTDTATPQPEDTTTGNADNNPTPPPSSDTDDVTTELLLKADKQTAAPSEIVTLTSVLKVGEETSTPASVTYAIVDGSDYATVAENKLTVAEDAPNNAVIKVQATSSDVTSNVLSITVVKPLTEITISTDASNVVSRGSGIILKKALNPADSTATVTWTLVEGNDAASLLGDVLVINQNAADGAVIKVKAVSGEIESNVLTFTVDVPDTEIPLETLAISVADNKTELNRGSATVINLTKIPDNTTDVITWNVITGKDFASMAGNILVVNEKTPGGTVIKIQAISGSKQSNTLTFTVTYSEEEENNSRYFLIFDEDKITLDKNGGFAEPLSVTVYNGNYEEITDCIVDFTVINGNDFIALTPDGLVCAISAQGHGEVTVRATLRGTTVYEEATIKVIVPPQLINLPEVFRGERANYNYAFSMKNPSSGAAYTLPFVGTPVGNLVCQDMTVTFRHADGTTGDDVATYANGAITFKKEGLVTVTISSNSGSRHETTTSYTFKINKGYNVTTFEELVSLGNSSAYNGTLPINLVVTQKATGAEKTYGFDLVPALAQKAKANQSFEEIRNANNVSARFHNKGVIINGNKHKIDASNLRVPTKNEIDTYNATATQQNMSGWDVIPAILNITPVFESDKTDLATYRVQITDLAVIGNCPIDFETDAHKPNGVYKHGIEIGVVTENGTKDDKPVNYYLSMSNVTVESCRVGMRLFHIVDGRIENSKVNNCFSNGFEIAGSILTLHDTTYGACGAMGIELICDDSTKAGATRDQKQQITYSGAVNFEFLNNNETRYMQNYKLGGMTVHQIITGLCEGYQLNDNQISHIENANGEIAYLTLLTNDREVNNSQIIYPGFQTGGIVNATELPKEGVDTTHEYIVMDIVLGGQPMGRAYFYNHHYVPAN